MRQLAHERGVTLSELSQQAEENPKIDKLIDARNKQLSDAKQVVIDSRLAFHFIPDSFTVYLEVDPDEAARRIHADEKETRHQAGEIHDSVEDAKEDMLERIESERARYKELYNIDHTNLSNYRLTIDTTDKKITAITDEVIATYKDWQEN